MALSANEQYKQLEISILMNIESLKEKIRVHREKQAKDNTNFGYVGDLIYIHSELKELLKSLN